MLLIKHPITFYLDGRLYEWTMGAAMIAFGIGMLFFPRMAHGSILQILFSVFNSFVIGVIFLTTGMARISALIANGNSLQIGPRVRAYAALISSVLWTTFTLSMARVSIEQGFPSPMVFYWGFFTAAEVYISYRAVLDVRFR